MCSHGGNATMITYIWRIYSTRNMADLVLGSHRTCRCIYGAYASAELIKKGLRHCFKSAQKTTNNSRIEARLIFSVGPIPESVLLAFVFCGRARRLDSKVKESCPSPAAIPRKMQRTDCLSKLIVFPTNQKVGWFFGHFFLSVFIIFLGNDFYNNDSFDCIFGLVLPEINSESCPIPCPEV
jgi:hypothetical protein